jgi:hypothetical protein
MSNRGAKGFVVTASWTPPSLPLRPFVDEVLRAIDLRQRAAEAPVADETARPNASQRPATPWWVKVIGIAMLVVLILAAVILVAGGGQHGPGMRG